MPPVAVWSSREQQTFLQLLLVNFESGWKESVQRWDQTKQKKIIYCTDTSKFTIAYFHKITYNVFSDK